MALRYRHPVQISQALDRILKLGPLAKTGLVLGGYVVAFMLASLA